MFAFNGGQRDVLLVTHIHTHIVGSFNVSLHPEGKENTFIYSIFN